MSQNYSPEKLQICRDLYGFQLFHTSSEVYNWDETKEDPLHRANTPLLARPKIPNALHKDKSSNVLLMSDHHNGFYDNWYEACQGKTVDTKEYISEYWQHTEVFNYFGHTFVMIPPPVWTNAGHRNGCPVLGTFFIGGDDAVPGIFDTVSGDNTRYKLVDSLVKMAKWFGFDGWLMNFEAPVGGNWNGGATLINLLQKLRAAIEKEIPGGKVIWYDALTKDNEIWWQSSVNTQNIDFAIASGSIVTDYKWSLADGKLQSAVANTVDAMAKGLKLRDVYMGVDCWSTTDRPGFGFDAEVTVDEAGAIKEPTKVSNSAGSGPGHGGLATGTAVNLLAHTGTGVGVGIFAQGWAYEHYPDGTLVDRFMWEGKPAELGLYQVLPESQLPPELHCHGTFCKAGGYLKRHLRADYAKNPITKFATRYPAGSDSFFHSDYADAYSTRSDGKYNAHLNQQSVLPPPGERSVPVTITPMTTVAGDLVADMKDGVSRCAISLVISKGSGLTDQTQFSASLPLHHLNITGSSNPEVSITYHKILADNAGIKAQLYAELEGQSQPLTFELKGPSAKTTTETFSLGNTRQVLSLGISVQGPAKVINVDTMTAELIDILQLTVKPAGQSYPSTSIKDVKLVPWGKGDTAHTRIVWSAPSAKTSSKALPYSNATGSFSHFVVSADGHTLGRAYALAFILDPILYAGWKTSGKNSIQFAITGIAFDGTKLATWSNTLNLV